MFLECSNSIWKYPKWHGAPPPLRFTASSPAFGSVCVAWVPLPVDEPDRYNCVNPTYPSRPFDTLSPVRRGSPAPRPRRLISPRYPLWSDGAEKQRYLSLPPGTQIDTSNMDDWKFPVGTRV